MKLSGTGVILTGATGGIGRNLARRLAAKGARVLLVARDEQRLAKLCGDIGDGSSFVAADVTTAEGRDRIVDATASQLNSRVNILINNAGTNRFGTFATERQCDIESTIATNVLAPMLLTRRLLPLLEQQKRAAIMNVGSIVGSIGLPGQVSYSTSKFALHGFTESLRRELQGSPVRVLYAAPRSTDTQMNSTAMRHLNAETGVKTDRPEVVAGQILRQLESGDAEQFIGWPERLFVKLNTLFPTLVDRGSRKSAQIVHETAPRANTITRTHGANP